MSLLATQGIGIFDSRHIAIENRQRARYIHGNTHQMCWALLSAWATSAKGTTALLNNIRVEGASLDTWLNRANVGPVTRSLVGQHWMSAWSLDLRRFHEDRDFRNEVSYRPDGLRVPDSPDYDADSEVTEPLLRCWEAFQPSATGAPELLDKHLLRQALRLAFNSDSKRRPKGPRYARFISQLSPDATPLLLAFLEADSAPHALLLDADQQDNQTHPASSIVARAALLLRVASALTSSVLSEARFSLFDFDFWWEKRLQDLGLWNDPTSPTEFVDLWAEVDSAIDTAEAWRLINPPPQTSRQTMVGLRSILALSQLQRVALWIVAS